MSEVGWGGCWNDWESEGGWPTYFVTDIGGGTFFRNVGRNLRSCTFFLNVRVGILLATAHMVSFVFDLRPKLHMTILATENTHFIKQTKSSLATFETWNLYRVSIKSFPDYKHLLQENYCMWNTNIYIQNVTQEFFYNTLVHFNMCSFCCTENV